MASRPREHAVSGVWGNTNVPVILLIAAMVVGVAALMPLVQTSGATNTAGHIRDLQQQREDWQAQLHEQEVKVAELGSLDRIDKEARERLRMGPPQEIHYISVDAPQLEPHRLPSRFLPQDEHENDTGSSLWEDITDWLPGP
jgi:cell division protein FtsL